MGHNSYATWMEDRISNLPDGMTYVNGFYIFNDNQKFADYYLAIKYYDEQVRQGWKYVPPGIPPVNTIAPTINGTARFGQTLTAVNGTWTGDPTPTVTRRWQRSDDGTTGWVDINGALTYTLGAVDVGKYIRRIETATNVAGTVAASSDATSVVVQAVNYNVVPAITGNAQVGSTLTLSDGNWIGYPAPTLTYKWQISEDVDIDNLVWTDISGATESIYNPVEADVGKIIRGVVTGTNSVNNVSAYSAATTAIAAA